METESDQIDPAASLRELHRAEILTHTRYPRLGSWYPPAAGLVVAIYCAALSGPGWLMVVAAFGFAVGVGLASSAYQKRRGVTPNPKAAPKQIQREMTIFLGIWLLLAAGLAALFFLAPWWVSSLSAFAGVTSLVAVYERRYANAASEAEAELLGGLAR